MINKIIDEINKAETIMIAGHIMPDGDDISSVASLVLGLTMHGKKVVGIIDDEIPEYLEEFKFVKQFIRNFDCAKENPSDLIIIVDASSPDRVGRVQELFDFRRVVVVDHHATNTQFGHINWVDSNYASTAQMVKEILENLNVKYNKDLATMNLTGIATDTGFFRYSNTDTKVFRDAADLIEKGAELSKITNSVLENKPIENLLLLKDVVNQLEFYNDKRLAISHVTLEMIEKYDILPKNIPPFVGDLRSLKGVEIAVMFNEHEKGVFHVSMRSKEWFDVSKIAFEMGGGGHPRAAGFSSSKPLEELKKITVQKINEALEK
ncbi:MAG: DHH family phosphoesterase [Thermotogota bacterium]